MCEPFACGDAQSSVPRCPQKPFGGLCAACDVVDLVHNGCSPRPCRRLSADTDSVEPLVQRRPRRLGESLIHQTASQASAGLPVYISIPSIDRQPSDSGMTRRELEQLVDLGEGLSLEFKRRVPRPQRIAKEIVALANTHGGRIALGVDDNGSILGTDHASEEKFLLRQAVQAHCRPAVEYQTERIEVEPHCDVLLVTIPESSTKPHAVVPSGEPAGPGTAYVRVEARSVEASPDTVQEMRAQTEGAGVTFEFGDTESLLMRYLDDYGRISVDQLAQLADISPERASQTLLRLTKADLLHLHTDQDGDFFTLNY